ncbi:MFS transporter [uncultured Pseudokineococcus sp.]|uniref:MFS transporter n=1 Tax=uncultured Pseudokineococcus sp. TaxID=1642928 RepID=UPI0026044E4A|nr:MFS transporter [uncultured Pseudokineococcus sp.]
MTSGAGGLGAYLEVLRTGSAVRPFAAAVVARLPISMVPFGTLLLVEETRGSFSAAGLVTAGYAIGIGVGSPLWGRLIDRHGQARVVAPTVLVSAALLAAFALAAEALAPLALLLVLVVVAGATAPPISSAMRLSWRSVLPERLWRTGYALDASAVEAVFVGGPLLLSLLLHLPPAGPLLVTAVVHAVGGLAYAASEPARRPPERTAALDGALGAVVDADPLRRASRVLTPPLVAVLAVGLAMAVAFGFVDTSMAATARVVLGDESRLGVLLASIAGGSVLGGLLYGLLPHSGDERRRLPALLAAFTAGLAGVAVVVGAGAPLPLLLPVLFLTGLCIAPALIVQQALVDSVAPEGRRGESQAWLATAVVTGGAGGTAAAGLLVDLGGPPLSLAAGSAALAVATALALGAQPGWARSARRAAALDAG